ncbi:MAG: hypothetical protein U0R64_10995 [Candidatus Nanopelagicales bacterium]
MPEREIPRMTSPLSLLLIAAAAVLATIAVALPLVQITRDSATATVNLTPSATTTALATVPLTAGTVEATGDDEITVSLVATELPGTPPRAVPPALKVLSQAGTSLWALGLAAAAFLLARVLADLAAGRTFAPAQARRFVGIAIAVLLCSAGADTVNYLNARLLTDALGSPPSIAVTPYYSAIPIAIAAVTLVLAGAFRAGRRIEADTEGLV